MKYKFAQTIGKTTTKSPSIRREWIEMKDYDTAQSGEAVSLHTEGVD